MHLPLIHPLMHPFRYYRRKAGTIGRRKSDDSFYPHHKDSSLYNCPRARLAI